MKKEDIHDWIVAITFVLVMIAGMLCNIILH